MATVTVTKLPTGGSATSKKPQAEGNVRLIEHMHELRSFSAGLLVLTELCSERMSMGQVTFFLFAGLADLAGRPATFTELRDLIGPSMSKSLHTTYKVFLGHKEREQRRQVALGWLMRELDPSDNRRKYLRLTKQGREIMAEVVRAVTGKDI